ncbi:MAG: restriction endonuclease subunit S [Polyangiaceae bacterium]
MNVGSVKRFLVPCPPKAEQIAIGVVLDALEMRVASEEVVIGALNLLKSALMAVLLTGELRVTPDEAAA